VVRTGGADGDALPAARVVAMGETSTTIRFWQNGQYALTGRADEPKPLNLASIPEPRRLAGPWTVAFDPKWGAPAQIKLPELISWTEHETPGVKYYSGAGSYTKTLEVPADWLAAGRRVYLDLGEVRELAEVFVNGRSAGILWKPPFRADITALVRPGANALKIEVMNLWINRLVGDQHLPDPEKFTRTNIRRGQAWEIEPAGLLGPVRLLSAQDIIVE